MKKFNWKMALENRWFELLIAAIWLLGGVLNIYKATGSGDINYWITGVCALLCCPCWVVIFFKRAKRDGC
jgi:membrane protein DedA with SNARE-associated domain